MLLPHNSVRGQQILPTAGATTQPSTLLIQRVLSTTGLRPQIIVYMQGRLKTGDYRHTTLATMRVQCSTTTCTGISRQPTKPVKTGKPLTSSVFKLDAGAHSFFGALLVEPRGPLLIALPVFLEKPSY